MSSEMRARQATYELAITEEAHAKLRALRIEEAIGHAAKGEAREAYRKLLMVAAIDDLRTMLQVPIDDHEIDKAAAQAKAELGQPN